MARRSQEESDIQSDTAKNDASPRTIWQHVLIFLYRFLFSLSAAITVMIPFSWPLLRTSIALQHTDRLVSLSPDAIMHNYNQLMAYLFLPWVPHLEMSDFPTSPHAAIHFAQCRPLFWTAIGVFLACLAIRLTAAASHRSQTLRPSRGETVALMLLFVVLAVIGVTNFDALFVGFHHLFFHNNYWLFDPATDPVINVLTEQFFAACAAVVALLYELSLAPLLTDTARSRPAPRR
jgi:integral membrane protein (TIGR01906 family)